MSGFGGAIKLTGESAYKKALQSITQNLKEVASEMKVVSSSYDKNDKSVAALTAKQDVLTKKLSEQTNRLNTLKAQYESMSGEYTKNAQKHQQLVDTYNKEKAKLDELKRTVGESSAEYQAQKAKVEDLAQAVKKSTAAQDANEKSMSKMRTEINNAQADCNETAREIKHLGDEAEEAGRDAKNAGDGFTVFKGIVADLAASAIRSAINGLKELGEKLINIGKQAYGAYAEYQQLVGGAKTLYGASADRLMEYANNAYATAGLSANKYMEQATSFAATLVQGLQGDTSKAADYANMAIVDMSDNVNKMGTDMTMVMNAYNGIAKQNYMMLDNLKIGYQGTASEMARLVNQSGVLGDNVEVTAQTVKEVPFHKIVEAIHEIQKEIGITGATTDEAETTITGSTAAMRAAWENLLVGIADGNQDVTPLLQTWTNQVIVAGRNAIPRVKEIVHGMVDTVKAVWNEIIPEIGKEIPELQPIVDALQWVTNNASVIISTLAGIGAGFAAFKIAGTVTKLVGIVKTLFSTLSAGTGIVKALGVAFSANPVGLIIAAVAALVAAFITLWNTSEDFRNFWIGLWDGIKNAFETAWNGITTFFTQTIPGAFNSVLETIRGWKDSVVEFFAQIPEKVNEFVNNAIAFFENLPYQLGYLLGEALGHIIKWGADAVSWVQTEVPKIIEGVVTWFKELPGKIWTWLVETYNNVVQWGADTKQKAIEAGTNFVNSVIQFIKELPGKLWNLLVQTVGRIAQFAADAKAKAAQAASNIFNSIVNGLRNLPSQMLSIGANVVRGIWNGISNQIGWIVGKLKSFGKGIVDGLKAALGIHSPSKVFADQVGKWAARGIGVGFSDEMKNVAADMEDAIPTDFSVSGRVSAASDGVAGSKVFYFGDIIINGANKTTRQMAIELQREFERTVSAFA